MDTRLLAGGSRHRGLILGRVDMFYSSPKIHTGSGAYPGYRFADSCKLSANLYDIYHCCVYSENPLMMDRGTVRNM